MYNMYHMYIVLILTQYLIWYYLLIVFTDSDKRNSPSNILDIVPTK